jgi:hypothetical protein
MCYMRKDFVLGLCRFCGVRSAQMRLQPVCDQHVRITDKENVSQRDRSIVHQMLLPVDWGTPCWQNAGFKRQPPLHLRMPLMRVPDGMFDHMMTHNEVSPERNPDYRFDRACIRCDEQYGQSNWCFLAEAIRLTGLIPGTRVSTALEHYTSQIPRAYTLPRRTIQLPPHDSSENKFVRENVANWIRSTEFDNAKARFEAHKMQTLTPEEELQIEINGSAKATTEDHSGGPFALAMAPEQQNSTHDEEQISMMHHIDYDHDHQTRYGAVLGQPYQAQPFTPVYSDQMPHPSDRHYDQAPYSDPGNGQALWHVGFQAQPSDQGVQYAHDAQQVYGPNTYGDPSRGGYDSRVGRVPHQDPREGSIFWDGGGNALIVPRQQQFQPDFQHGPDHQPDYDPNRYSDHVDEYQSLWGVKLLQTGHPAT